MPGIGNSLPVIPLATPLGETGEFAVTSGLTRMGMDKLVNDWKRDAVKNQEFNPTAAGFALLGATWNY